MRIPPTGLADGPEKPDLGLQPYLLMDRDDKA
jgi:hypothetical protein